jgi:hypothetical protein
MEIVLILLFMCHWLADYTHLSTNWMLNAKKFGKPLFPIFTHALVHAILMSVVLYFFVGFTKILLYLGIFQLITHFIIDTWKGKMNVWFTNLQSSTNKWHWVIFGLDQLLHSIVIILICSFI